MITMRRIGAINLRDSNASFLTTIHTHHPIPPSASYGETEKKAPYSSPLSLRYTHTSANVLSKTPILPKNHNTLKLNILHLPLHFYTQNRHRYNC